jgi:hypothetical protein
MSANKKPRDAHHITAHSKRRSAILIYHPAMRVWNRTKFLIAVLAAVTLIQPALSVAGDKSTDSRAAPSSFVPHPHTNSHVYGSPIQPAVVGHARTSHHKQTPKKRSSVAARSHAIR